MTRRVLITCPQLQSSIDDYRQIFLENDIEIELPPVVQQLTESQLLEIIEPFDGVIAGDDEFTGRVLDKAKNLKCITRWGIGMDGVDLMAAERLGIRVSNTPNVFSDEAADVAMGYIILLARQLHKLDQGVRSGIWPKIQGVSLRGKTLGVIGVGSIGQALVRRAAAAGMSVLGHDIVTVPDAVVEETGLRLVELDELLESSDFISLNCNLNSQNYHMLGPREFAVMRPGLYIINTARGPLIDESALIRALKEGKLAGAALDVFEVEPLPAQSPLRQFENCIFGTHNSSNTQEAVIRVNRLAITSLLDGLTATPR
tara:strand:- start:5540 stop:6484 length:945 start_codon:yes stop_codon:yes gene_type:complete